MKTFKCTFYGREVNAIGVSSWWIILVEAETRSEAMIKCYDTHEHINGGLNGIRVEEVK